jgi:hypothetical protein
MDDEGVLQHGAAVDATDLLARPKMFAIGIAVYREYGSTLRLLCSTRSTCCITVDIEKHKSLDRKISESQFIRQMDKHPACARWPDGCAPSAAIAEI